MIYNYSHALSMPVEDVLYKWSYENLLLLSLSIPQYDYGEDRKERKWDGRMDANDPKNFSIKENSNIEDEEFIV